jgi:hypothetical protein
MGQRAPGYDVDASRWDPGAEKVPRETQRRGYEPNAGRTDMIDRLVEYHAWLSPI